MVAVGKLDGGTWIFFNISFFSFFQTKIKIIKKTRSSRAYIVSTLENTKVEMEWKLVSFIVKLQIFIAIFPAQNELTDN